MLIKQEDILSEVKYFYQCLLKITNDNTLNEFITQRLSELFQENITKLTQEESVELEGSLSINELSNSLRATKNGKRSGLDGFSSVLLKLLWGKLKFFMLRALNHAYHQGEMSISLRQCIISCLPKGNTPRHFLKNLWPILFLSLV